MVLLPLPARWVIGNLDYLSVVLLLIQAPKPVAPKPEPPAKKTVPKTSAKAGGKKEKVSEAANEVLADPVAEKLRQQR